MKIKTDTQVIKFTNEETYKELMKLINNYIMSKVSTEIMIIKERKTK